MFLDCTLRDGGYYNNWCFSDQLVSHYLNSLVPAGIEVVELGFRSLKNSGFLGANAFTTDSYLRSKSLPKGLAIAVMINGAEIVDISSQENTLAQLFPERADDSPVDLVRIACHVQEFSSALSAVDWLKDRGYQVGFNLMQVADRTEDEVKALARNAARHPLDVLYFADSMGSMNPDQVAQIIRWIRAEWRGEIGIHTHDNLGLALSNTLRAIDEGVTWIDSTVTGMGRGPGNARTEELAIEVAARLGKQINLVPLMALVRKYFKPMQEKFGWGTNPYYYLAGKYGIHPTYIQEMLSDSRYNEEDLLAVIEHLRVEGGKKFSLDTLDAARHFYIGEPTGKWNPRESFEGRDVLLLGTGPGVAAHREAIEHYIRRHKPLVLALNTQNAISAELVDMRVACHPVRLLADCAAHASLPQPLITPYSMLPEDVKQSLGNKEVLDFGVIVQPGKFEFSANHCTTPTSLVVAYALAVVTSGHANQVLMAGFDGYDADDPRSQEMRSVISLYRRSENKVPLTAITPTRYDIPVRSVYAL